MDPMISQVHAKYRSNRHLPRFPRFALGKNLKSRIEGYALEIGQDTSGHRTRSRCRTVGKTF